MFMQLKRKIVTINSFFILTYISLLSLAVGIFTSISFSSLGHIFLLLAYTLLLFIFFTRSSSNNNQSSGNQLPGNQLQIKSENTQYLDQVFKIFVNETKTQSKSFWALCFIILVGIISVLINMDLISNPIKNILSLKYFLFAILAAYAYKILFNSNSISTKSANRVNFANANFADGDKDFLSEKKLKWLIYAFLFSTTIASISGLIALYSGFNPLKMKAACHPTRTCGLYGMYMTYGYGMQFFCLLLVGIIIYRDQLEQFLYENFKIKLSLNIVGIKNSVSCSRFKQDLFLWLIFTINFVAFVLSFARGALLGFFIALPFLFYNKSKKIFLLLIILPVILFLIAYSSSERVKGLFSEHARIKSNETRVSQIYAAIEVFKENPFFGIGYKNFEPYSGKIKERLKLMHPEFVGHAHNNFFEHLASTGVFGFLGILLFHLFWFFESIKRRDVIGNITWPIIIALFISGQFQYTMGDGENMFFIMNLWALSQVKRIARKDQKDQQRKEINFCKYQAVGNDFVIIDNRKYNLPKEDQSLWSNLCDRKMGVGADGVLLLDKTVEAKTKIGTETETDFQMTYINSDGKEAEMCGNGARSIAHFAHYTAKVAAGVSVSHANNFDNSGNSERGEIKYSFNTAKGIYNAAIILNESDGNRGMIKLEMTEITDDKREDVRVKLLRLLQENDSYNEMFLNAYSVNTGVPHLCLQCKNKEILDKLDLKKIAPFFRFHDLFSPAGTNVNFFVVSTEKTAAAVFVRTYERGVEDETLSCGTGAVAVAISCKKLFVDWKNIHSIKILAKGGELNVYELDNKIFLGGEVVKVFDGLYGFDGLYFSTIK